MAKIDSLNPLARKMALALFTAVPKFKRSFEVQGAGDFSAYIRAPKGSKAHGLRVCTVDGTDVWIQFGWPNAFYLVDDEEELILIVHDLMADRVKFAVTESNGVWTGTTLVRSPKDLVLKRDELDTVISWSGTNDDTVSPNDLRRRTTRERGR